MTGYGFVLLVAVLLAFIVVQQILRHHRRVLVHQERMAAIEKGVALTPVEQEIERRSFNTQRTLLLAGLIWISLGVGSLSGDISSLLEIPFPSSSVWRWSASACHT